MPKSNVIQCEHGHFYDGNKYKSCPHCGSAPRMTLPLEEVIDFRQSQPIGTPKNRGLFSFGKKPTTDNPAVNKPVEPTRGLRDDTTRNGDYDTEEIPKQPEIESKPSVSSANEGSSTRPGAHIPVVEAPKPPESIAPISIAEQIYQVKTTADNKTIGLYTSTETSPAVGWIIALSGEYLGESFELREGRNSLGRMGTNIISFAKENSISREKHAFILYDPKKKQFYIQAGESSGLTYLNDENVMMPTALKAYDKIQLGQVVFLFIPLCGEQFNWDEYIR